MTTGEKGFYKVVGYKLKELRQRHHLTQQQLSDRCGLSKNHISALEHGKAVISCSILRWYAIHLIDSADSLLGIGEPKIHPELSALIGNNLDYDQQQMLLKLLYAYIENNNKKIMTDHEKNDKMS